MKLAMFKEANVAMGASTETLVKLYNDYYEKHAAFHFVFEENEQVVAMAGGFIKSDFPFCLYPDPEYGFIGDVYVTPDCRRQGHARILSNKVIEQFKKDGTKTIRLLASDAARPLYESLGFTQADMMVMHLK